MPTLYTVIPCFNEPETLAPCVAQVLAVRLPPGWSLHVVLIDDASHADTGAVAERLAQEHPQRLTLLKHGVNRGKGAAVITGFTHVLLASAAGDATVIQDADLEYDPADYARLVAALGDSFGPGRAAFGNRWHSGNDTAGFKRTAHRWVNGLLTRASNLATGYRLADMECCYKAVPVVMLRRILPELDEARFGIEPQITAALARQGVPIAEVPVSYAARSIAAGKKIRPRDGLRALWVIMRERWRGPSRMRESAPASGPLLLLVRLLGAAIGLGLIGWCCWAAISRGDWSGLRHAEPGAVVLLLGASLATLLLNGLIFWITARPMRPLGMFDLQAVNAAATFLNYAPLRAGMVARVLFHIRVDGMAAVPALAWLFFAAFTTLAALVMIALPSMVLEPLSLSWGAVLLVLAVVGTWLCGHPGKWRFLRSRLQGAERIMDSTPTVAAAVGLRLVDITAWIIRMTAAASILGIDLPARDAVVLGTASLVMAMNPIGRVGFREAAVAFVAARLSGADSLDVPTLFLQLAVLESAAEAAVAIPAGLVGTACCLKRWGRMGRVPTMQS